MVHRIVQTIRLSWSGTASSSLSSWLDPIGSGVAALDTLNPNGLPTGACCVGTTGACLDIRESNCLAGGGTYLGDNTVCADGGCTASCPADIDGSGAVNVTDLLEIVGVWGYIGASPADVNGDNVVNVGDLLMVIDAWGPC